jgi:glutaryl-CoA dehydrogenase (non-decarboxylating)
MALLSENHRQYQGEARAFADEHLLPGAARFDEEQRLPPGLIRALGECGYLGALVPGTWGGADRDMLSFAILNEELGRGCSSTRGLVTVHSMVTYALTRWGSEGQKAAWLPRLASGARIGAFALSEPGAGSDATSVELRLTRTSTGLAAKGVKQWISFGQIADVFLVFGTCDGQSVAFLANRAQAGIRVEPILGLLGARASMLASVEFDDYRVKESDVIGRLGFGFAAVALSSLNIGRLSVAAGAVGMAQRCAELSQAYANQRIQFGKKLNQHELIQRMLANITTNLSASRLLCYEAARCLDAGGREAIQDLMKAKYFCTRAASAAARDAVQIHGAVGCTEKAGVARLYRDAKVMELIEGSNEILQSLLGSTPPESARAGGQT